MHLHKFPPDSIGLRVHEGCTWTPQAFESEIGDVVIAPNCLSNLWHFLLKVFQLQIKSLLSSGLDGPYVIPVSLSLTTK
jgi:hypothetical protein